MPIHRLDEEKLTEGISVPPEWEGLDLSRMSGLIMLVGGVDTGKTTLFRYLLSSSIAMHGKAAALDADPGQSRLGPPTTISLGMFEGLRNQEIRQRIRHWFVGATTPAGHMLQMLSGCGRLLQKAREISDGLIIMDTSGLVDPEKGGVRLKLSKIDLLQPSVLIVLQKERELESWIRPLRIGKRVSVIDMPAAPAVRERDYMERQSYRENSFRRYFKRAVLQDFYWPGYGVFPYPRFDKDRLLAFEDKNGFTLGLGIVQGVNIPARTVTVFSPLTENLAGQAASIQIGDVVLDPATFQHALTYPAGKKF
ncbi:MAG: polynucleotide 5'-hydroxyl-kinase [Desulfobacterales bacterium]|nr:polynucleotide 5'-hydroxyl-kinase [Desulfobacterales bacterium]